MSEAGYPELPSGPVWALGLMSGTSMDGVDAALLRTDGDAVAEPGSSLVHPYDAETRAGLRAAVAGETSADELAAIERRITDRHAEAVAAVLEGWRESGNADPVVIGFHGHTLWHRPDRGETRQIGDGARLAARTGLPVIDRFRDADMAAGGEGAPLAPLYHAARLAAAGVPLPAAVLNLGGVANVTWIGAPPGLGGVRDGNILAFDTGPGCAPIDDWVLARAGASFDRDGALAAEGEVDRDVLARLMDDPYFRRSPPKSLDRAGFELSPVEGLEAAAGAATLTAFAAGAVARGAEYLPAPPKAWYATGGGRLNVTLMAAIGRALGTAIEPVEALGWNGDTLEAEAFAYLAVRSLKGAPLSLPGTTGATRPTTGGTLHLP